MEILIILLWLTLGELTIIKLKNRPHKFIQILISPIIHTYVLIFHGLIYYVKKDWDILTNLDYFNEV